MGVIHCDCNHCLLYCSTVNLDFHKIFVGKSFIGMTLYHINNLRVFQFHDFNFAAPTDYEIFLQRKVPDLQHMNDVIPVGLWGGGGGGGDFSSPKDGPHLLVANSQQLYMYLQHHVYLGDFFYKIIIAYTYTIMILTQ